MIMFPLRMEKATLVTRATIIAECRLREEKQILTEKQPEIHEAGQPDDKGYMTCKSKADMGFSTNVSLMPTKGTNQIQIGDEDEEKTAFNIEQGRHTAT
ncbi:hypothetical protein Tco_1256268 [Tanacetum coccineum]